jgi:hypothetical protein
LIVGLGILNFPYFYRYSLKILGINIYLENAIFGRSGVIKFLTIFCSGRFHIYLASSSVGYEINNSAS